MRIYALATAVFVFAAPAASLANTDSTSAHVAGEGTSIPPPPPNTASTMPNGTDSVQSSRFWRCPRRRGYKVTHMTFRRGRSPLCHVGNPSREQNSDQSPFIHSNTPRWRRAVPALATRPESRPSEKGVPSCRALGCRADASTANDHRSHASTGK